MAVYNTHVITAKILKDYVVKWKGSIADTKGCI
jgi:hypothetical protein